MKARIIILSATVLLSVTGCSRHAEVENVPQTGYIAFHSEDFVVYQSFELVQPYHYRMGMSRDEVRTIFGQTPLVSSFSRPEHGWRSMTQDSYGVGYPADAFELSHADVRVVLCEVYHAGGGWHVLFFDSAGRLVGFQRTPDSITHTYA